MASLRHACAIIMLSNQHLDTSYLWGGWIISAKVKCSLTQIYTDLWLWTIFEWNRPFEYIEKVLSSAHEKWRQKQSVAFIISVSVKQRWEDWNLMSAHCTFQTDSKRHKKNIKHVNYLPKKIIRQFQVFAHNFYFMNKSMNTNIQMFVVCKISYLFNVSYSFEGWRLFHTLLSWKNKANWIYRSEQPWDTTNKCLYCSF